MIIENQVNSLRYYFIQMTEKELFKVKSDYQI